MVKQWVMIIFLASLLLLTACGSQDASTEDAVEVTGSAVVEVGYSCGDLGSLTGKVTKRQDRVDAEAKELLTKRTPREQRVQKFKVMKLDREVKKLRQELVELKAKCQ